MMASLLLFSLLMLLRVAILQPLPEIKYSLRITPTIITVSDHQIPTVHAPRATVSHYIPILPPLFRRVAQTVRFLPAIDTSNYFRNIHLSIYHHYSTPRLLIQFLITRSRPDRFPSDFLQGRFANSKLCIQCRILLHRCGMITDR